MALSDGTYTLVNSSTTYNSMATYECSIGFELVGSDKRTCQTNGQWSGSEPTCQSEGRCTCCKYSWYDTFKFLHTLHLKEAH